MGKSGRTDKQRAGDRIRRAICRQYIDDHKRANPCQICGESDIRCLDFHHIDPSNKGREASEWASRGRLQHLIGEIGKCIVVCSNCHRKLTFRP
jgi:hypothetical protein